MKRRTARVAVLLAATATLLATATPPASATTVKDGVFIGQATTGPLGYPCTPAGTLDCIAVPTLETKDPFKTVPTLNVYPAGGNTVGYAFSSTLCVKGSVTVKPLGGGSKPTGPALCQMQSAGVITGFCGLSTAKGVMAIINLGPPPFEKSPVFVEFTWTEVAHVAVITGESGNTQIVPEAVVIHDLPAPIGGGGHCTNKTNTSLLVVGNFTILTKTLIP